MRTEETVRYCSRYSSSSVYRGCIVATRRSCGGVRKARICNPISAAATAPRRFLLGHALNCVHVPPAFVRSVAGWAHPQAPQNCKHPGWPHETQKEDVGSAVSTPLSMKDPVLRREVLSLPLSSGGHWSSPMICSSMLQSSRLLTRSESIQSTEGTLNPDMEGEQPERENATEGMMEMEFWRKLSTVSEDFDDDDGDDNVVVGPVLVDSTNELTMEAGEFGEMLGAVDVRESMLGVVDGRE